MKILIVSDTHRKDENLKWVIRKTKPFDMLIHLGDAEGSEYEIMKWVDKDCDLEMIMGNNDFFSQLEREKEIMIGKYKVLLTHGHYYNVSTGPAYLKQEARERGFDIVMFGHTHRPYFDIDKSGEKELITLNPGSLSYPRQEGHRPSYMLMKILIMGKPDLSSIIYSYSSANSAYGGSARLLVFMDHGNKKMPGLNCKRFVKYLKKILKKLIKKC